MIAWEIPVHSVIDGMLTMLESNDVGLRVFEVYTLKSEMDYHWMS